MAIPWRLFLHDVLPKFIPAFWTVCRGCRRVQMARMRAVRDDFERCVRPFRRCIRTDAVFSCCWLGILACCLCWPCTTFRRFTARYNVSRSTLLHFYQANASVGNCCGPCNTCCMCEAMIREHGSCLSTNAAVTTTINKL